MLIYVLNSKGEPLMPTERSGKVRHMLKSGRAKVVSVQPFFTIRLTYETTSYMQPVILKMDSGYKNIGASAVNEKKELLSCEAELLDKMKERLKDRLKYRMTRRNRLRYRKCRFSNRRRPEGWLAPSLQHKLDSHIRLENKIRKILPVKETIIEVASFDTHKLKNPEVEGAEYQEGRQKGFWNVREYVLHRDGHKCQHPKCTNKSEHQVLRVHHHKYWTGKTTDNPDDLVTTCDQCHTPRNHEKGQMLWGWKPNIGKDLKEASFMTTIRWELVNILECSHSYGWLTKSNRIEAKLPKTHHDDAFCIDTVGSQKRCETIYLKQVKRNNRSLELFYDAKYIDSRTGETATGKELFSGRTARNKNKSTENLHQYRQQKLKGGRRSIRTQRYSLQPNDIVLYNGEKYAVAGVQNKGSYVKLKGLKKVPNIKDVTLFYYGKSFVRVNGPI